ncbi:hypothetical protein [Streptomyces sp. NPDC059816]|uniref:hypothetical protein n=1 Tax=Streptomyces sp. NPDC059816 TaxID=3346960 RepID=UPI003661C095
MAQTEARPKIVALLCDTNFTYRRDTSTWSHRDGRPFTAEEQTLASLATRADLEEVKTQHTRYMEYVRTKEEAPDALQQFLAPFMERLDKRNLGNARELMTEDERASLDHLLRLAIEPVRPFTPYTF